MEVMEDGNLMDKVNILIQRDMEYYKAKQAILQETICPGIIGGKLDFPRYVSFASMKLVLWWEEEFVAAFKKHSGFLKSVEADSTAETAAEVTEEMVKDSDPTKFVGLVSKSADQLLEHLHVLTQEALDHADITVLTGTIGAAALIKNCLWFYIQTMEDNKTSNIIELQNSYKKYYEMSEALAERLLDLHCRLLSLYILQDAESLDWESSKPFFEYERGSYIIQMWWLYMNGTREDLWNTVPPKMAQRVFSGMLNESLTILTVRYTQSVPSESRSQVLIVDISNLLLCVAQLLPSICKTAKEFVGCSYNMNCKIIRDIHTKCQDLFSCMLLRGSSLDHLHKLLRRNFDNVEIFKSKNVGPAPWIVFALPNIFKYTLKPFQKLSEYPPDCAIALELMVLLAQPQPNWSQLLKVVSMKKCRILDIILSSVSDESVDGTLRINMDNCDCGGFLCYCDGSCKSIFNSDSLLQPVHYFNIAMSATEILLYVADDDDLTDVLLQIITKNSNWHNCFDKKHVWNQIRPSWYEAILNFVTPLLKITSDTVVDAVYNGATIYQAMSLIIACFSQYWDCTHPSLAKITSLLQEVIPLEVVPINCSCLFQVLSSALYANFLEKSKTSEAKESGTEPTSISSHESVVLALAEALCSIDEDNKHTDQIDEFLLQVSNNNVQVSTGSSRVESNDQMVEVLISDIMISNSGKQSLKTLYQFIQSNSEWVYQQLNVIEQNKVQFPNRSSPTSHTLTNSMFYIGYTSFDQVLMGDWAPKWKSLLQMPMGLNPERVWYQLAQRWEFRNSNAANLTIHTASIVNEITLIFRQYQ